MAQSHLKFTYLLLSIVLVHHLACHLESTSHNNNNNNKLVAQAAASVATSSPQLLLQQQQTARPIVTSEVSVQMAPKSERQPILEMFSKFFIKARSHDDQQQKELVRDGVIRRLQELGFEEAFLQKSKFEFRRRPATSYNMIGIVPGKHRRTKNEKIVLVGAHWDSATKAPVSTECDDCK